MAAVAAVLIGDLHLHFFGKAEARRRRVPAGTPAPHAAAGTRRVDAAHPVGPILYGLLVVALVAAVVISVWWSYRLSRPAPPLAIAELRAEELREAVESGRAALARIDDARPR